MTRTQQKALELAASHDSGELLRISGGYWVTPATTREQREALSYGRRHTVQPQYVATATINVCTGRGWLRLPTPEEARGRHAGYVRILTDAGRQALAAAPA